MLLQGVVPDRHTLPRILSASRLLGSLHFGRQLHCQAMKFGLCTDQYVNSALIELYGFLDGAEAAKCVFDKSSLEKNLVSWTLLARCYVKEGQPNLAVDLFNEMLNFDVKIDAVAMATAINACGLMKSLQEGRKAHQIAKSYGLELDVLVSNSLLKMYIDCGSIHDARFVFDQMKKRDEISWTSMVHGCVKKGEFNEGLKLFRRMIAEGLRSDAAAISSVLPACGRMAAHKNGKEIHGYMLRNKIDMNMKVQNALMDMYVKSGFIELASKIFISMKQKDEIAWTVMIFGYSLHGQGMLGVDLFKKMMANSGIKNIDQVTYATVLYACCTSISVEEGKFYFNYIKSPNLSVCVLMVALLARGGLFDEARRFIREKIIARQAEVLRALLDGCRIHNNVNLGKRVVEQLCELEPLNANNYVLLSNLYAYNGRWDMVDSLKETIRDMGLSPKKAYSWIEFRNKVHVFGTGDVSHPRSEKIYYELECLMKKVEEEGVKFDDNFSLHDVDEERECILIGHSELLAVSFGLISTRGGETVRVTKNVCVCRNCHQFVKAVSKIVGREIIVKDPNCFHHFKDGACSCRNF